MTDYTVTEISHLICEADGLTDREDMKITHERVRHLAKRGFLNNGQAIDERGTLVFPEAEVFHAAVLCDLLSIDMGAPVLRKVTEAAEALPLLDVDQWAPSQRGDELRRSFGGLLDAIRGAAAGERWGLTIRQEQPGRSVPAQVHAAFGWLDAPGGNGDDVAAILGRKPNRLRVVLELTELFTAISGRLKAEG
ncbi:hypothetical protein M8756_10105 [Lutimaribacter sp. EGI FJ00015]|uniref:Uncharacterized protein n=1 Tax=Lutimaribacter degradans TaxID=2945989 RepID=A0ACC5ZWN0_9RHOB|nr:hypothetical protein [Lutimaribacter sp. EGI FJ00013]MCM2562500.1 hypothetical protein [Lutimaribacter sp. EGI FJ00013]MCO0613657.1 hypothetical protein [Lutimaribacter sp. EGI FJ00015]MCO0636629.1 hypothetical protein [Lutimaribacter sp. EGI FJ00014]